MKTLQLGNNTLTQCDLDHKWIGDNCYTLASAIWDCEGEEIEETWEIFDRLGRGPTYHDSKLAFKAWDEFFDNYKTIMGYVD